MRTLLHVSDVHDDDDGLQGRMTGYEWAASYSVETPRIGMIRALAPTLLVLVLLAAGDTHGAEPPPRPSGPAARAIDAAVEPFLRANAVPGPSLAIAAAPEGPQPLELKVWPQDKVYSYTIAEPWLRDINLQNVAIINRSAKPVTLGHLEIAVLRDERVT
jgi:hypothetical protein